MGKRALQAALVTGIAIGGTNLWFLAERYRSMSSLEEAEDVIAISAPARNQLMQRMELRCGPYAKLYAACENTNSSIARTMSIAARETGKIIVIEAIASGAMLFVMLMAFISLHRNPGKHYP